MKQLNLSQWEDKDMNLSRRKQGKRNLATEHACKVELRKELRLLFKTFYEALENANNALSLFPPYSRSRTLEASIIQSSFAEILMKNFDNRAFYGRYKRLILRTDGYLVLFKKLNTKGHPMNIKTMNVQSILNQSQVLDLFADSEYNEEPILYFGYQKNRYGQYTNPQLVYIDEDKINFTIRENDVEIQVPKQEEEFVSRVGVTPKLKDNKDLKKIK